MKKVAKKNNKTNKDNKMKKIIKGNNVVVMDEPFLTPPGTDGIAVVVDMPDAKLHGQMNHEILCGIKEGEFLSITKPVKTYAIGANIPCPDIHGIIDPKDPCVCIMSTAKDHDRSQVRIKFNPEKLFAPMNGIHPSIPHDPALDYLNEVFQGLCGQTFLEFIAHGRVTVLDVYRQICGRAPDDYLFRVKYARSSQSVFGAGGKIETMYFGKRASNQVKIYNKAIELYGKAAKTDTLRVECSLKPKNMKFADLWSLENPFKKITIHSMWCAKPPLDAGHWSAFQDSCRLRGISKAIALQPKQYQHKLRKTLANIPVTWWQMSDDEWFYYWHGVLENTFLNQVPDHAPPLTMGHATGGGA